MKSCQLPLCCWRCDFNLDVFFLSGFFSFFFLFFLFFFTGAYKQKRHQSSGIFISASVWIMSVWPFTEDCWWTVIQSVFSCCFGWISFKSQHIHLSTITALSFPNNVPLLRAVLPLNIYWSFLIATWSAEIGKKKKLRLLIIDSVRASDLSCRDLCRPLSYWIC